MDITKSGNVIKTNKIFNSQSVAFGFIYAIAFVVFLIVRIINKFNERIKEIAIAKKGEEVEEPTTKTCPFCQSEISIKAVRCPHCTSVLEQEDEEALSN